VGKYKKLALFLKNNIVCDIPAQYDINPVLKNGIADADIVKGIKGFNSFLPLLFDDFIGNEENFTAIDESVKTSTAVEKTFPDLVFPVYMLYCIGLYGEFNNNNECIRIDGNELNSVFKKVHGKKPGIYLQILSDLGFEFSIPNLSEKSFNLNKAGLIEVRYPDAAHTLIGLKLMAEATSYIKENNKAKITFNVLTTIFMRCDYHALTLPERFIFDISDVAGDMEDECKTFLSSIHNLLISNKCTCEAKYIMNEFIFTYTSKPKKAVIFSVHKSMNGCYVKLNSKLINEDSGLLSNAPESIKDAVKNGYTCAKINDPNACNPKCNNLKFILDGQEYQKCRCLNFNLPMGTNIERKYVEQWLNKELA